MASDIRFSTNALNGMLDSLNAVLGSGALLRFYDAGTAGKPATADTAITDQVLLAELTLSSPNEFGAAASRVITAASIASDVSANANGECTWASFVTSAGVRVFDVTVGEAADSADITVDTKDFQIGATIAVSSFTLGLNL